MSKAEEDSPGMPNSIGENRTKRKLAAGELVLFMGVNQMRTPNIAMIAASCGFGGSISISNTTRYRLKAPSVGMCR